MISSRYVRWSKYISLYMLVFTDMYAFTFLTSYMSERSIRRGIWCTMIKTVMNCSIWEDLLGSVVRLWCFCVVGQESGNSFPLPIWLRFDLTSPHLVLGSHQTSSNTELPFNMSESKINQSVFWLHYDLNIVLWNKSTECSSYWMLQLEEHS